MQWINSSFAAAVGLAAVVVSVGGCGSGSGGTGAAGLTQGRSVNVYVTDRFNDAYSQVVVTLYKIEGSSDGQNYQTLFEDSSGQTLDLTSLASAAQLLGTVQVPAVTFTQVRVTLGDHVLLVPRGGGSGTSVPVDSTASDVVCASGQCSVTLSATVPAASGRLSNLVVDFNLASFELIGGRVRPSLQSLDPNQLGSRVCHGHLAGMVTNLSAGVEFDLQGRDGHVIHVNLTDTTVVSADNGQDATLANGQSVVVEGTVDPATTNLTATSVHLLNGAGGAGPVQEQGASGTVASVNASAGSFILTVERASHVIPAGGSITVQTDQNTMFHQRRGDSASLADVVVGQEVMVDGTFDAESQTLAAKLVLFHPGPH